MENSLREFSRRKPADDESLRSFLSNFRYCVLDIGRKEDYRKLLDQVQRREEELGIPSNRMFYLSVGPEFFETIALNIQASGLGAGTDGSVLSSRSRSAAIWNPPGRSIGR